MIFAIIPVLFPPTVGSPVLFADMNQDLGHIRLGTDTTREGLLIGENTVFNMSIQGLFCRFAFSGLKRGENITFTLKRDGIILNRFTDTWIFRQEGVITRRIYASEGMDLEQGNYSVEISSPDRILQDVLFTIEEIPDTAQEHDAARDMIIDQDLMPAYEILNSSTSYYLRELAEIPFKWNIPIRITDDNIDAIAVYQYQIGSDNPGIISCSRKKLNEYSVEEIASTLAHEIVHARQHIQSGSSFSGCTIENEYEAYLTELHLMNITGRNDILMTKWRGIYDENGDLNRDLLWKALSNTYDSCPAF